MSRRADRPSPETEAAPLYAPARAALWMVGTMLSLFGMALGARALAPQLDTFEIMLYRSLLGCAVMGSMISATGGWKLITTKDLRLHGLRNIAHFSGQNLWFYAIAGMPLATVFAFEFTTPIWVAVFATLFLGEEMTRQRLWAIFIGFLGILIITRPGSLTLSPALIAAFLCAIGFAGSITATKALSKRNSVMVILFWLVSMQAVMALICAGYDGDIAVPEGRAILWVSFIGLAGLSAHGCMTRALTLAPATIIGPVDYLRLPLAMLLGYFWFGEALSASLIAGAAVIILSNFINLWAKPVRLRGRS